MKNFKFNPVISFDGVAIIIGVITLAIWMGRLDQRVTQNSINIDHHTSQLDKLNDITTELKVLVATKDKK